MFCFSFLFLSFFEYLLPFKKICKSSPSSPLSPETLGGAGPGPLFEIMSFMYHPQKRCCPAPFYLICIMKTEAIFLNYFIISNMPLKIYPLSSLLPPPHPPSQESHRSKQELLGGQKLGIPLWREIWKYPKSFNVHIL